MENDHVEQRGQGGPAVSDTDGVTHGESDEDDPPDYRISHLMDDIANAFGDQVQNIAPLGRGGVNDRVSNRVTFYAKTSDQTDLRKEIIRDVESTLEDAGFEWTTGEPRQYVVLGREITDLRELRKGDRIHMNHRRGPFRVFRVIEQPPEVLQRSDPAITVELSNEDTDTDWMLVQWDGDDYPWSYVYTVDKRMKAGYRFRKVEQVEWMGRIGPRRLFAPPAEKKPDVETQIPEHINTARENQLGENRWIHPMDLDRVEYLFHSPKPDVFTTDDANLIRNFLLEMSGWYEKQADALNVETDDDKERAHRNQQRALDTESLADVFKLLAMDPVEDRPDEKLYTCECGKAFTDRFKYPTHRREDHPQNDKEDDNQ